MKLLDGIDLERRLLVLAPSGKEGELARSIFAEASPGYHALSRRVVESVIEKYAA